jgi:hypothetical protein
MSWLWIHYPGPDDSARSVPEQEHVTICTLFHVPIPYKMYHIIKTVRFARLEPCLPPYYPVIPILYPNTIIYHVPCAPHVPCTNAHLHGVRVTVYLVFRAVCIIVSPVEVDIVQHIASRWQTAIGQSVLRSH